MTEFKEIGSGAPNLRESIEAAMQSCEKQLGISLTLHDLHGICRDERGESLLMRRNEHSHHLCRLARDGTLDRCQAHCVHAVHTQAAERRRPFSTWCWKGIREVVVPIVRGDLLLAIIYAGAWRRPRALPQLDDTPQASEIARRQQQLPLWNPAQGVDLARQLELWGHGLLDRIEQNRHIHGHDRASCIHRFLARRAHEAIGLEDLAIELSCSTSRAGHIVVEELGVSFRELLQRERIDRAKVLLATSTRPLADIAEACGYHNEYYFNRAFSQRTGMPPGRWRGRQRRRWDGV